MATRLVIVESPAKAKTIGKILGPDYDIRASMGHICDLPQKAFGVDIEKGFEPKYVVPPARRKVMDQLKKAAAGCDEVFLAPDPDREGEAIAWHLREALKSGKRKLTFYRVQYNEITPRAVRDAFAHPGELDQNRVDAQQARRVLDRIVGYKVSPVLWRKIQRGLSAGRVQSVALRLLCEREDEIERFVPEPFFLIGARVRKFVAPPDEFVIRLARVRGEKETIREAAAAALIVEDVAKRRLRVTGVQTKAITKKAPPPFITSTLQQAGSSRCGFSPNRTMSLAQKLYEGIDLGEGPVGLITYMRTDSFFVSRDAQEACRAYIFSTFGSSYYPATPNVFRSRSGAQEAHEAIRPTSIELTPQMLEGRLGAQEAKLYNLIWRRFLASQMTPAQLDVRTVDIAAEREDGSGADDYLFQASASEIRFPGYMKVDGAEAAAERDPDSDDEENRQTLPPLKPGEPLECLEWLNEEKQTSPPPRFSEASLIKELEKNGVGRPSTYAQILATLQNRNYAERQKRSLVPTALGRNVNGLLVHDLEPLFNVEFTATMEEKLDEIENGRVAWRDMLAAFYRRFEEWMEGARVPDADTRKVRALLTAFNKVERWETPTKRGKRTYDDQKFIASLHAQLDAGEKPVSERQLNALARIAGRYSHTVPSMAAALHETGFEERIETEAPLPPRPETILKLKALEKVDLDERGRDFIQSLRQRVDSGRRLSDAQVAALDRVLKNNSALIQDYEALCAQVGITSHKPADGDPECEALIESLARVQQWNAPTKRGKKVYDDKAFFDSLASQYRRKGALSDRQKEALQKLARRYKESTAAPAADEQGADS